MKYATWMAIGCIVMGTIAFFMANVSLSAPGIYISGTNYLVGAFCYSAAMALIFMDNILTHGQISEMLSRKQQSKR